ncbi:alpha-1,6-glucosidase domain-containing protein [Cellvibrio sp. NN19]|uniref:alpha-1,6-glucosidase domain-containing protein n=1 Tax=Cellvibrio chitinivorans TaxID=3102792 RepID=UPI002B40FBDE|nr:alpha-1,6-glucosidase domain-containing protein [Cellvibrio sp. NN19]
MISLRASSTQQRLGFSTLVFGVLLLSGCGGGSGTDNKKVELPTCRDPQVVLDNGTCGDPRPPFVPPACPEGQIYNDLGVCVTPDFPIPERIAGPNEAVIFVNVDSDTKLDDFASYNLHLWQDCGNGWGSSVTDGKGSTFAIPTTWPNGPGVASKDDGEPGIRHDPYYGAYFVIPVSEAGSCGNYIIKTPGGAAQTNDLQLNIKRDNSDYARMAWVIINTENMRNSRVSSLPICIGDKCTLERPLLSITDAEAHWISPHTILWSREISASKTVELFQSTAGGMNAAEDGSLAGGTLLATLSAARPMTEEETALVPHLSGYFAYDLPANISTDTIKSALKDELLIVGRYDSVEEDESGASVTVERGRATRIQLPHVLDALYTAGDMDADEAKLGVSYENGVGVSVWAPTAQNVELRIYSGDPLRVADTKAMQFNSTSGVWTYTGTASELDRKFYRFRVTTYNAMAKKVQRLEVTDPYSVSLATNGRYSQFVNLNDADTKPAGWDGHHVPEVVAPEAMTIYEGHVRDFSINDQSTPEAYRGKYMAFTQSGTAPVEHLQSLVDAGLTHFHVLPSNDSSNMNEDFSAQVNLDSYIFQLCQKVSDKNSVKVCDGSVSNGATVRSVLEGFDPMSADARELIAAIADLDGFNWGYDPQHFNAPDGNYATDPQGFTRVKEMRAMNMALHSMGLRVVMDVVYPHTVSSGSEAANSVFDKVVPGYYYRTNPATGEPETGTFAGPDTATEHRMMGKFVADSVVQWAQAYQVDGFRFDQSGYMPKAVLVDAYNAVKAIDPDTYFYAEAWTPAGGTSGDRIAERAVQEALAGTGIGTFNDRMRNPLQQLALVNGGSLDAVRAGLAGNLADFQLKTKSGSVIKASSVGAYNLDPQEAINYVEKHDNETLWDWMHRPNAVPEDMSLSDRVRVSSLTLSVPVLSQGVPFIQMGSDLLRSKSMSPNSYNAGDWFNAVDFTMQSNNWGVGLPPELRDGITDEFVKSQFANPNTKPAAADIMQSGAVFNEFLQIASSSPLFSLQSAEEVMDRVGFHDGGKTQVAGLIVMSIDDGAGTVAGTETARADLDAAVDAVVVVINSTATAQSPKVATATGFTLHQIQQNSVDSVVRDASFAVDGDNGVFTVPAYTTAVFVKAQSGAQGDGLDARVTLNQSSEAPPPYAKSVHVRGDLYDGWNAGSGNEMTYHGKGIYSLVLELEAKTYNFKVAAADWSEPNLGSSGQALVAGGSVALAAGGGDMSVTIPVAGKYRFELDASTSTTAPTLKLFIDPFSGAAAHVRGSVASWDADINNQLTYEGNGIYALELPIASEGDYEFKVASSDWSTVNMGNPQSALVNSELPLIQGSNDNIKIHFAVAATYRFEVNVQDPALPTVKVFVPEIFGGTAIFVRGGFNGWGTANQLVYQGDGTYAADIALTAQLDNYEFKVASEDWATVDRGIAPENPVVVIGTPATLQVGGGDTGSVNAQINVASSGTYSFVLNANNPTAPILTIAPN